MDRMKIMVILSCLGWDVQVTENEVRLSVAKGSSSSKMTNGKER